jgi:RNA-directed DNA polymerase
VPSGLDRVRRALRGEKDARFTALLHHVDLDRLRASYRALEPKGGAGVGEVAWEDFGRDFEANVRDFHARVHRGRYRGKRSRCVLHRGQGRR